MSGNNAIRHQGHRGMRQDHDNEENRQNQNAREEPQDSVNGDVHCVSPSVNGEEPRGPSSSLQEHNSLQKTQNVAMQASNVATWGKK
jgi:hypothetical protein